MIDPVTLAVIQAGLQQVCDEMDLTFSRAAFSPVIAEAAILIAGILLLRLMPTGITGRFFRRSL